MTVLEAVREVQRVGTIEVSGGNLRVKIPEGRRDALQPAIETLKAGNAEALAILSPDPADLERASAILNRDGVRIMRWGGEFVIWHLERLGRRGYSRGAPNLGPGSAGGPVPG